MTLSVINYLWSIKLFKRIFYNNNNHSYNNCCTIEIFLILQVELVLYINDLLYIIHTLLISSYGFRLNNMSWWSPARTSVKSFIIKNGKFGRWLRSYGVFSIAICIQLNKLANISTLKYIIFAKRKIVFWLKSL